MSLQNRMSVITAIFLMAVFGCSSDLSRSNAKALIQANSGFASTKLLPFNDQLIHNLAKDGLYGNAFQGEARNYFADGVDVFTMSTRLQNPMDREVVEVTGISPMGSDKTEQLVEFTYRFKNIPVFVSKYAPQVAPTYLGKAAFKKYDDGWRLEEAHCSDVTANVPDYYNIRSC